MKKNNFFFHQINFFLFNIVIREIIKKSYCTAVKKTNNTSNCISTAFAKPILNNLDGTLLVTYKLITN